MQHFDRFVDLCFNGDVDYWNVALVKSINWTNLKSYLGSCVMQIRPMLSGVFNSHNEDGLYPTGIGGAAAGRKKKIKNEKKEERRKKKKEENKDKNKKKKLISQK